MTDILLPSSVAESIAAADVTQPSQRLGDGFEADMREAYEMTLQLRRPRLGATEAGPAVTPTRDTAERVQLPTDPEALSAYVHTLQTDTRTIVGRILAAPDPTAQDRGGWFERGQTAQVPTRELSTEAAAWDALRRYAHGNFTQRPAQPQDMSVRTVRTRTDLIWGLLPPAPTPEPDRSGLAPSTGQQPATTDWRPAGSSRPERAHRHRRPSVIRTLGERALEHVTSLSYRVRRPNGRHAR